MSNDKEQLVDEEDTPTKEVDHTFVRETICGFDGLKFIIVVSLLFAIMITIGMVVNIVLGPPQIQPYGAIVTDAAQCSQVGLEILEQGGSAVDAGIAATLCLGVVHPHASGLGGGGFLIVGNPKKKSQAAYNFREMSPEATTQDMFKDNRGLAVEGGKAVAVPGEIDGLRLAWETHGTLAWEQLFHHAISLARNGFRVTQALEEAVRKVELFKLPKKLRDLLAPGGIRVNHNQETLLSRPEYANKLEELSRSQAPSVSSFGNGIIALVEDNGGNMSFADVSNYTAVPMNISSTTFYKQQILTTGAPSNGPLVLMLMNIMEKYNYTSTNQSNSLFFHRFVEALKFAQAYTTDLGDPDVSPQVEKNLEKMLGNSTTAKVHGLINDTAVLELGKYYPGKVQTPVTSYGGAQVLVMSSDSTMVSISSSINSPFGAKLMTEDGIILNNAMDNFDWEGKSPRTPSKANLLAPNKRPQSDLAPLLSWNASNFCTRRFALGGSSGISARQAGSRSGAGVAQIAIRLLMGHNLTQSITPSVRVFNPLIPDALEIEGGLTNATLTKFGSIYDKVFLEPGNGLSVVHGLMKEKDLLYAEADFIRRPGAKAAKYGRP